MAARLKLMPSALLILGAGEKAERKGRVRRSSAPLPPGARRDPHRAGGASPVRTAAPAASSTGSHLPARPTCSPPLSFPFFALPYLPGARRTPVDMVSQRPPPSPGCEETSPGPLPPHGSPTRKLGRRAAAPALLPPGLPRSGAASSERRVHRRAGFPRTRLVWERSACSSELRAPLPMSPLFVSPHRVLPSAVLQLRTALSVRRLRIACRTDQ